MSTTTLAVAFAAYTGAHDMLDMTAFGVTLVAAALVFRRLRG